MGKKRIGNFIRGINFLKLSNEDGNDRGNEMLDVDSEIRNDDDDVQFDEVKDGFAAFADKVCVPKFPERHSGGYWAAYSAINILTSLTGYLDEDEKAMKAFGKIYVDTWLALLKAGPSSGQTDLMSKFHDDLFKDHIKSCGKKEFAEIFSNMKITFRYDPSIETDHDERLYASLLHNAIGFVFGCMEEEQLLASQQEFLDLYHHYQKQLPGLSEEFATYVGYLLRDMVSGFPDENPYIQQEGAGPTNNKESIELVKSIICDTNIQSKEQLSKLKADKTLEGVIDGAIQSDELPAMIGPLMSLVVEFAKSPGSEFGDEIYGTYRRRLFRKMDDDSYVPGAKVYEACLDMVLNTLPNAKPTEPMEDMMKSAFSYCIMKFPDMTQPLAKKLVQAMVELLQSGRIILVEITVTILRDDDMLKRLKWKSFLEEAKTMLRMVGKKPTSEMQRDKRDELNKIIQAYKTFCEYFMKSLRKAKVADKVQKEVIEALFDCVELENPLKGDLAYELRDDLTLVKPDKDLIMFILTRCKADLLNKELTWTIDCNRSVPDALQALIESYNGNGKLVTPEQHKLFAEIFNICMEGDTTEEHFVDYNDAGTVYLRIYQTCIINYFVLHRDTSTQDCCIDVIPGVIKWAKIGVEESCEPVTDISFGILQNCSVKTVKGMENYLKDIMELMFLSEKYSYLTTLITKLYPDNPDAVHAFLPDMFDKFPMMKDDDQTMLLNILMTISNTHPEAFTEDQIKSLVEWHIDPAADENNLLLVTLRYISEKIPKVLVPHLKSFLKPHTKGHAMMFSMKFYIVGNVAVYDKTLAEDSMDFMVSNFNFNDPSVVHVITGMISTLMKTSPQYMHKYRKEVEKLEKTGTTPGIKDGCRHILNVLDGKVIEEVFDDVQETKENVTVIDKKVDTTINTVITIGDKVVEHDKDISNLENEVDKLEERVDDVEDDLGETKIKVEEIDNKTMTNAPKWSRDLTKLMNPKSDTDWRLLAQRLQYSNDDIRGWAQQHDPCMALLSEWYATHKTSEATHAILKILEDMNRMDAVAIVENAMKASEGVVEDEEFEYASPPPIFLSYQWGMQEEVKLLKQHLLMAGFECWMDIGQMGGGDKLFNKIDDGIRAAKMVISCTTEKYAKSPNCNREVNLAVNLGKPIIPLLMEKMDWPPKGSMGPIFSEYLFIRFFQRSGEETKESDQRYWPLPKFNELLMQINLHIVPDETIVSKEYKNWWKPIVQDIVIDKNKGKGKTTPAKPNTDTQVASDESPLVFLSYQWGRQPQVMVLYQRLTSLGYSVWMDIHQMGGGDSLYDKIDRGLRGCQVIVSCVTPKYSLSANCRREVSLADALKKPIIPLLLEEMKWPPGGPMSMVFTELLFINMYRDPNIQTTWSGPKFDELLLKLQEHVPSIQPAGGPPTSTTKTAKGNGPKPTDPKLPPGSANKNVSTEQPNQNKGNSPGQTNATAKLDDAPKAEQSNSKPKINSASKQKDTEQSKGTANKWEDKVESSPKSTEKEDKTNDAPKASQSKALPQTAKDTGKSQGSTGKTSKSCVLL